jgi:hypothetical protein
VVQVCLFVIHEGESRGSVRKRRRRLPAVHVAGGVRREGFVRPGAGGQNGGWGIWSRCRGIWRGGSRDGWDVPAPIVQAASPALGCSVQPTMRSDIRRTVSVFRYGCSGSSGGATGSESEGWARAAVCEAQSRKAVREIVFLVSAAKQLLRMANQPV